MSELGMGDERILPSDLPSDSDALFLDTSPPSSQTLLGSAGENTGITGSDSLAQDASTYLDNERDLIEALPVVVLRNFASKGSKKDELWNTIAEWSAGLIENRVSLERRHGKDKEEEETSYKFFLTGHPLAVNHHIPC